MNTKIIIFLALAFSLSVACKKADNQESNAQTAVSSETATAASTSTPTQERALTPEEQAEQTYARARRLSMDEASDFVKYPQTLHEKIASRVIRRVNSTITLTEEQQQSILNIMKSYPEESIKGKEGQAKRRQAMERAYKEVLTAEQQEKVSSIMSQF